MFKWCHTVQCGVILTWSVLAKILCTWEWRMLHCIFSKTTPLPPRIPFSSSWQHSVLFTRHYITPIWGCHLGIRTISETHFINIFSTTIEISWRLQFVSIQTTIQWFLQNFAHVMSSILSWCVQKFVAISWPAIKLNQNELRINNSWWHGYQDPSRSCFTACATNIVIFSSVSMEFNNLIITKKCTSWLKYCKSIHGHW